jgi:hypothetical protein
MDAIPYWKGVAPEPTRAESSRTSHSALGLRTPTV